MEENNDMAPAMMEDPPADMEMNPPAEMAMEPPAAMEEPPKEDDPLLPMPNLGALNPLNAGDLMSPGAEDSDVTLHSKKVRSECCCCLCACSNELTEG